MSDDPQTYANGVRAGLLRAMTILHDASVQHYADAVATKSIVGSEGHTFAARLLQSHANGMEIEAGNVKHGSGEQDHSPGGQD